MNNKIITINRQFGSGGREIAKKVAETLDFAFYDKQLINEITKETNISDDLIEKYSETPINRAYVFHFGVTMQYHYIKPIPVEIQEQQAKVIKKLANKGDSVFVGRCSNHTLKDVAPLKVFIYCSDMDKRILRYKDKDNSKKTDKEIKKDLLHIDKHRSKYYEEYTTKKWTDMSNYDLCIDTAHLSSDDAVELIVAAHKLYIKNSNE